MTKRKKRWLKGITLGVLALNILARVLFRNKH